MDYEYEYGRYKKKVEDQQKEIMKLHGMIEGMKQVQGANNAIIAAMLVTVGATKEQPLEVKRELISEMLASEKRIVSDYNAETAAHSIFVE